MNNEKSLVNVEKSESSTPVHVSCSGLINSLRYDGSERAKKARDAFKHVPNYNI